MMSIRTLGAALAVALSALACQPGADDLSDRDERAPQISGPEQPVAPGTVITAGSGALTTAQHRLAIQVGGAPSGHVVNDTHALRAGR